MPDLNLDWSSILLWYGVGILVTLIYMYWPFLFGSEERRRRSLREAKEITETEDMVMIHGAMIFSALIWPASLVVSAVILITDMFRKDDE